MLTSSVWQDFHLASLRAMFWSDFTEVRHRWWIFGCGHAGYHGNHKSGRFVSVANYLCVQLTNDAIKRNKCLMFRVLNEVEEIYKNGANLMKVVDYVVIEGRPEHAYFTSVWHLVLFVMYPHVQNQFLQLRELYFAYPTYQHLLIIWHMNLEIWHKFSFLTLNQTMIVATVPVVVCHLQPTMEKHWPFK